MRRLPKLQIECLSRQVRLPHAVNNHLNRLRIPESWRRLQVKMQALIRSSFVAFGDLF
jgi:hypothetical protein